MYCLEVDPERVLLRSLRILILVSQISRLMRILMTKDVFRINCDEKTDRDSILEDRID